MNRLLSLLVLAISVIAGYKKTIAGLQDQLTAANTERDTLRGQVASDAQAEAGLTRRAEQAEADKTALEQQIAEANSKADELAKQLEAEPAVPTVDSGSFEVTTPPTEHLQDLAFRENQAQNSGNVAPNPAPAVTSPDAAPAAPADQTEGKSSEEENK